METEPVRGGRHPVGLRKIFAGVFVHIQYHRTQTVDGRPADVDRRSIRSVRIVEILRENPLDLQVEGETVVESEAVRTRVHHQAKLAGARAPGAELRRLLLRRAHHLALIERRPEIDVTRGRRRDVRLHLGSRRCVPAENHGKHDRYGAAAGKPRAIPR